MVQAIDASDSTDPSKLSIIENNIGPQITTTRPLYTHRHHPVHYGDLDRTYYPSSGDRTMYRRSDDAANDGGQSKVAAADPSADLQSDEDEDDKYMMFPYYGYRRFYQPFFYRRTYPIFF